MNTDPMFDRRRGVLVGLAVGDDLGAAVDFEPPGSFQPDTGGVVRRHRDSTRGR